MRPGWCRPIRLRHQTDRERHLALRGWHIQLGKQANQVGVGALVEHQKPGIDRVGDAVQRHVNRVGMATESYSRFKQRDLMAAVPG